MSGEVAAAEKAGIHALAIPTPFAVGRVNCYLIEDEPLTLIDTGPNSGKSLDELERALVARGRRIEELERIVITHQHMDHLGLLEILARRSRAEVCALRPLGPYLADFATSMALDDEFGQLIMRRHGVPADLATVLGSVGSAFRAFGSGGEVTRPLDDRDRLQFAGRQLLVLHRPGHSPSDTVFLDERRGILIGGDHLLARISSNPLVSRPLAEPGPDAGQRPGGRAPDRADGQRLGQRPGGRAPDRADGLRPGGRTDATDREPRALVRYIESLRATRELPVALVLPGHGEPIRDHARLIDDRLRMHERRARKLHRLLRSGPMSAYELALELWGNVALTQAYLTISEVVGHMDLLVERQLVRRIERGGVVRFESTQTRSAPRGPAPQP